MPWREPSTVPFTRIGIVSQVPPEAGVFGIIEGEVCLYVGDTWNLRGRLLELANVVENQEGLSVVWERCPESECTDRRLTLEKELNTAPVDEPLKRLPGIHLRSEPMPRIV
jgi:hypothetical protein